MSKTSQSAHESACEAQRFTGINSVHPHSDPVREAPVLAPLTGEERGSERLPRVTQVVVGG